MAVEARAPVCKTHLRVRAKLPNIAFVLGFLALIAVLYALAALAAWRLWDALT